VAEYAKERTRLKQELKKADREDRKADVERIREELEQLDRWRKEDVERNSTPAFVIGIVLTSTGGASVLTGLGLLIAAEASDAADVDEDIVRGLDVATVATLLSGAAALGVGIPLAVWGGERVMKDEYGAAPGATVVVGASGVRVEGSF
jgi:hypothetical protein